MKSTYSFGHGHLGLKPEGAYVAHRVAYFISTGVDPEEKCVLHRCDNPPCVNPSHLFLGTKKENMSDMVSKDRFYKGNKGRVGQKERLSAIDVTFMREMFYIGGIAQIKIAEMYSISRGSAFLAVRGKTWKHIPMPG